MDLVGTVGVSRGTERQEDGVVRGNSGSVSATTSVLRVLKGVTRSCV